MLESKERVTEGVRVGGRLTKAFADDQAMLSGDYGK